MDSGPQSIDPCRRGPRRTSPGSIEPSRRLSSLVSSPFDNVTVRATLADVLADLIARQDRTRAVPSPVATVPVFRDDASIAGLRVIYENDPTPLCRLPETMGGGVGLIDYDGDGLLDVYAVQGGKLPSESNPPPTPQGDRLFRNRGDGTFEDVTASAAGLWRWPGGYGHGVTVGDYDNDGHPDVLVTRWRAYALYRNRGDGRFEDVTAAMGPGRQPRLADLGGIRRPRRRRRPGPVRLPLCRLGPCSDRPVSPPRRSPQVHVLRPARVRRHARSRVPQRRRPVRGCLGVGGIRAADREGRGLGVVAAHLDDDDLIDLFVANDMSANYPVSQPGWVPLRGDGAESGVATNADGGYLAGMGIACGDFDGDGRLDLAVTNFYGESTTFYRTSAGASSSTTPRRSGLAAPSRYRAGIRRRVLRREQRRLARPGHGQRSRQRPAAHRPFRHAGAAAAGRTSGRVVDVSARGRCPLGRCRGWAAAWLRRRGQRRAARPDRGVGGRPAGVLPQPGPGRPLRHAETRGRRAGRTAMRWGRG